VAKAKVKPKGREISPSKEFETLENPWRWLARVLMGANHGRKVYQATVASSGTKGDLAARNMKDVSVCNVARNTLFAEVEIKDDENGVHLFEVTPPQGLMSGYELATAILSALQGNWQDIANRWERRAVEDRKLSQPPTTTASFSFRPPVPTVIPVVKPEVAPDEESAELDDANVENDELAGPTDAELAAAEAVDGQTADNAAQDVGEELEEELLPTEPAFDPDSTVVVEDAPATQASPTISITPPSIVAPRIKAVPLEAVIAETEAQERPKGPTVTFWFGNGWPWPKLEAIVHELVLRGGITEGEFPLGVIGSHATNATQPSIEVCEADGKAVRMRIVVDSGEGKWQYFQYHCRLKLPSNGKADFMASIRRAAQEMNAEFGRLLDAADSSPETTHAETMNSAQAPSSSTSITPPATEPEVAPPSTTPEPVFYPSPEGGKVSREQRRLLEQRFKEAGQSGLYYAKLLETAPHLAANRMPMSVVTIDPDGTNFDIIVVSGDEDLCVNVEPEKASLALTIAQAIRRWSDQQATKTEIESISPPGEEIALAPTTTVLDLPPPPLAVIPSSTPTPLGTHSTVVRDGRVLRRFTISMADIAKLPGVARARQIREATQRTSRRKKAVSTALPKEELEQTELSPPAQVSVEILTPVQLPATPRPQPERNFYIKNPYHGVYVTPEGQVIYLARKISLENRLKSLDEPHLHMVGVLVEEMDGSSTIEPGYLTRIKPKLHKELRHKDLNILGKHTSILVEAGLAERLEDRGLQMLFGTEEFDDFMRVRGAIDESDASTTGVPLAAPAAAVAIRGKLIHGPGMETTQQRVEEVSVTELPITEWPDHTIREAANLLDLDTVAALILNSKEEQGLAQKLKECRERGVKLRESKPPHAIEAYTERERRRQALEKKGVDLGFTTSFVLRTPPESSTPAAATASPAAGEHCDTGEHQDSDGRGTEGG